VNALAISPEEDMIVSGGDETKIQLYSVKDNRRYQLGKTDISDISNS
jgi:hypothetical protein